MNPYYQDGWVTLYHGDCREILPTIDPSSVALVLTDPPYGVSERTNRKEVGRGKLAECNDFPPVFDDDKPFDPSHLLRFRRLVLFGGNYYADKLPSSPSWIIWDKRDGLTPNDNADVELAWTNLGGPARTYHHRWNGMVKDSEHGIARVHPTQKPVSLMAWIIDGRTQPGDLILDPYTGSGSTLRAAKDAGRHAIGIEIDERYCEVAARRMAQEVLWAG